MKWPGLCWQAVHAPAIGHTGYPWSWAEVFSLYVLLWNFQRFGIMLGLPFPGAKTHQNCRLGFLFTLVVFIWSLAIGVFSQRESRAPCFREEVCMESYLWHPEFSVFPKEGLMVGKVVSSWDSAAVTGYGPGLLWTVCWASADFFLGLTFP